VEGASSTTFDNCTFTGGLLSLFITDGILYSVGSENYVQELIIRNCNISNFVGLVFFFVFCYYLLVNGSVQEVIHWGLINFQVNNQSSFRIEVIITIILNIL
jgi:hypothetical protein